MTTQQYDDDLPFDGAWLGRLYGVQFTWSNTTSGGPIAWCDSPTTPQHAFDMFKTEGHEIRTLLAVALVSLGGSHGELRLIERHEFNH